MKFCATTNHLHSMWAVGKKTEGPLGTSADGGPQPDSPGVGLATALSLHLCGAVRTQQGRRGHIPDSAGEDGQGSWEALPRGSGAGMGAVVHTPGSPLPL